MDKFSIGGQEIGIHVPKSVMNLMLKIMTPDIFGFKIVFQNKFDKCTLIEVKNGPHTFMTNSEGNLSKTYYEVF